MFVEILLRIGEKLSLKQKTYRLNRKYLIKVSELMTPRLRKPKLKPRVLWGDGEILPIILIDTMEGITKHDKLIECDFNKKLLASIKEEVGVKYNGNN